MANPASVLTEFRKMGLDRPDLPVLLLIPMAVVAWADGQADEKEIDAIIERHSPDSERVADTETFTLTESARAFLCNKFVYVKPDSEVVDKAIGLLAAWLDEMEPAAAQHVRVMVVDMCMSVAERSGGFLGLFGRVSEAEAVVLRNLFARLHIDLTQMGG